MILRLIFCTTAQNCIVDKLAVSIFWLVVNCARKMLQKVVIRVHELEMPMKLDNKSQLFLHILEHVNQN